MKTGIRSNKLKVAIKKIYNNSEKKNIDNVFLIFKNKYNKIDKNIYNLFLN